MEATLTQIEAATIETTELADLQAITELSAHDLALVGGGIATVVFM
jgi:hypothetical protein